MHDIVTLSTILISMVSAEERKEEYHILSEFMIRLLGQELAIGNKITDLTRLFDFLDLITTSSIISSNLPGNQVSEIFEYIREKNELSEKRVRQLTI